MENKLILPQISLTDNEDHLKPVTPDTTPPTPSVRDLSNVGGLSPEGVNKDGSSSSRLLLPPGQGEARRNSAPEVLGLPFNKSRRGSHSGPPKRDLMLEHKISKWIMAVVGDGKSGHGPGDFGGWIEDGSVLADMMTNLCFNSVPMELVTDKTGEMKLTPKERVSILIDQLRQYGVPDSTLFSTDDLLMKKNIPKVTRCLAIAVCLAEKDQEADSVSSQTRTRSTNSLNKFK